MQKFGSWQRQLQYGTQHYEVRWGSTNASKEFLKPLVVWFVLRFSLFSYPSTMNMSAMYSSGNRLTFTRMYGRYIIEDVFIQSQSSFQTLNFQSSPGPAEFIHYISACANIVRKKLPNIYLSRDITSVSTLRGQMCYCKIWVSRRWIWRMSSSGMLRCGLL
jgi:hypothetical protein